ncbi:MAG: hypothetical protein KAH03_06410 [Cocleimonas sp.]|nr:hypothetical protein [Cocleimonas sp.]
MKKSINITIMTMCGLILAGSALAEGNSSNGKKIYSKSECLRCHQTNQLFTRKDRKVKTLPQLNSQVRKCDTQLNTHLFHDEIEDVVAYLNQAHYKFPVKKNNNKTTKEKTNKESTDG